MARWSPRFGAFLVKAQWIDRRATSSFVVGITVLVFVVLPVLPLLFAPREVPGRRAPTAVAAVAGLVLAVAIPWGTAIDSNGMRLMAILAFVILTVRVVMAVHGAVPSRVPQVGPAPVSPDMVGIDRPLTLSDAIDADRALGIDEELSALHGGGDRQLPVRPVPVAGS